MKSMRRRVVMVDDFPADFGRASGGIRNSPAQPVHEATISR